AQALKDEDAFVRRRACEALVRAGLEPPVESLRPLLQSRDRFLRTAARLVLQRIGPGQWAEKLCGVADDLVAWESIVALCKIDRAAEHREAVLARLRRVPGGESADALLDYLRTLQLALLQAPPRAEEAGPVSPACEALFPQKDVRANREVAIVLTHCRRQKWLPGPVHARLLQALLESKGDRPQQIHYFYCLRLLHEGWTANQKDALLAWYEGTRTWRGGFSFTPFLENILRD